MPSRAVIFAVVALLTAAGLLWVGYTQGQNTKDAEWLARENSDLREARKETERLVTQVKEKQIEYNKAIGLVREFERRPTVGQLRHQELATLAARADADRLRAFAAQAERDLERLEAERSRFGIEAAEASAAAHALNLGVAQ